MRRLYTLMVLSVIGAIVLSTLLSVAVMHFLRPHVPMRELGVFPPSLGLLVHDLEEGLAASGSRSPAAILEDLGHPLHTPTPEELEDFAAFPHAIVQLSRGGALTFGAVGDRHDVNAWLLDGAGRPLLVSDAFDSTSGTPVERNVVMVLIALFVAAAVSVLMTVPITRGFGRLIGAARSIRKGDLTARAGAGGVTHDVGVAFDAMADRLEQLLDDQQELLQAISHELRTPTARIRFSLEMLASASSDEARARRIAAIDEDLAELDELVAELVTFSRVSAAPETDASASVSVPEAIAELVAYVCERHPELEITARPAADVTDIELAVAPRLFNRAVRNVLLNASRYAKGRIIILWERRGEHLAIEVLDDGPGIAEPDRSRIFDPFMRADRSRSRDSGGLGLGLAIVRRIVEVHGGDVYADEADGGGARIVMRWPLSLQAPPVASTNVAYGPYPGVSFSSPRK